MKTMNGWHRWATELAERRDKLPEYEAHEP